MDDLPRHWSDVDEITDLAEATQIEIDTRSIILPTAIAKIKKPENAPLNRAYQRSERQPQLPALNLKKEVGNQRKELTTAEAAPFPDLPIQQRLLQLCPHRIGERKTQSRTQIEIRNCTWSGLLGMQIQAHRYELPHRQ